MDVMAGGLTVNCFIFLVVRETGTIIFHKRYLSNGPTGVHRCYRQQTTLYGEMCRISGIDCAVRTISPKNSSDYNFNFYYCFC